jgi:hypothetical protein
VIENDHFWQFLGTPPMLRFLVRKTLSLGETGSFTL